MSEQDALAGGISAGELLFACPQVCKRAKLIVSPEQTIENACLAFTSTLLSLPSIAPTSSRNIRSTQFKPS